MRVMGIAPLLALLAAPLQVPAHPHDGGDALRPYELLSFFPSGEQLEVLARGGAKGAMLGVALGGWTDGAVEGLNVMSVSPGGPAELAGLRSGDMLTTFNGDSLASESGQGSYGKLRELLAEVEPGSEVTVGYRRGDRRSEARIATGAWPQVLAPLNGEWQERIAERAREWAGAANSRRGTDMAWRLGGLEIAELTPALGEYFGADRGLLVVRAPDDEDVPLEGGDIIRKIGGRNFKDARQATRILRSYEPGEEVELEVLRHKRSELVSFRLPERGRAREVREFRRRLMESPPAPQTPEAPAEST